MSLMNDMLKDLDRRGAGHDRGTLGDHHRARHSGSTVPWAVACGFIVLLAVAAMLWWWPRAPQPSTQVRASEPASAPIEASDRSPDEAPGEDSGEKTAEVPEALEAEAVERVLHEPRGSERLTVAEAEPNPENRERIETLLASARTARARDRLTRPVGDNAYEYYQQVLAITPDEPEALAGLAAIAQRYRELAEAAMDREALAAARRFLQRARSVRPGAEGIQASEARLATLNDAAVPTTEAASGAESATDSSEESLSVRPDPASVDRRRADRAERLWSQGNSGQARTLLETTLREWSFEGVEPVQSIGVLFDLYLDVGELGRAQALLEQDRLPEDARVYRRAQLALANGQTGEALTLLEAGAQSATENEKYRALMARLYYEQQRFEEAAAHYRALLTDMGNRPAYWLGLGLARDALDDVSGALNAFRQALASGAYRDDAAVREYLQNRINALTRRTQAQES